MEETNISETLALVEDLVKSRREELQLVFFDWMQHLHSNLVVLFVLLCSLVVSCYPDIPKRASLNLMLKIEHAQVKSTGLSGSDQRRPFGRYHSF
jgi:hypothetical protein